MGRQWPRRVLVSTGIVVLVAALIAACGANLGTPLASHPGQQEPTTSPAASAATPILPATTPAPARIPAATPAPTAPDGPTPTPLPTSDSTNTYVRVQPGDTLSEIAERYGLTLDLVLAANPQVADANVIRVGQVIGIPNDLFTGDEIAVIDTLGSAGPETRFDRPGSWGIDVRDPQTVALFFTIDQPMLITEIGGYLYDPTGAGAGPWLQVDIVPAIAGGEDLVPDVGRALAAFEVARPPTRETISYVSVAPAVILPAGGWFAVIHPQPGGEGGLLGGASTPFEYRAGSTTVWLSSGSRPSAQYVAVRVLGRSSGG